jgi:S-DNA-T family DNA segregation ATPase FtsK/SpoIIIE
MFAQPRRSRWEARAHQEECTALVGVFRDALINNKVAEKIDGVVSGNAWRTPAVTSISLGPPVQMTVRMLPGMLPADIAAVGARIAPSLGGKQLRVTDHGHGWCTVLVLDHDPLAATLPLVLPRPNRTVLLGRTENGDDVEQDWHTTAHSVIQGVTRSGKSVLTYGILAQLAGQPDVIIAGCDPTALLLRPFADTRHAEWQTSGGDFTAHQDVLERLCDEMDRRITQLPDDRDTIAITEQDPLLVVVLEEYAGFLGQAKLVTDDKGKRIEALVSRLLAEGAKCGIRCLVLLQRAEAAVMSAFMRSQCSLRISFRVDNRASVELLHEGTDPQLAAAHTTSPAGVAFITRPGQQIQRIRAPYLGGYPEYRAAILAACGEPPAPSLRVVS